MKKWIIIGIIVSFFLAVVFLARTELVMNKVEDLVFKTTNGFVDIGDMKGNLLFCIRVYDLNIGRIATADTIVLRYSPLSLLLHRIKYIEAEKVIINTVPPASGEISNRRADRTAFVFPVDVDRFKIKDLMIRGIPNTDELSLFRIDGTARRVKEGVTTNLYIDGGKWMNVCISEASGVFLYAKGRFALKEMWINTPKSRFLISTSFERGKFNLKLRSSKIALAEFAHLITQDISGYLFCNLDITREEKLSGKGNFIVKDVAYKDYTINKGNVKFSMGDDIIDATFKDLITCGGEVNGVMRINLFPFSYRSRLSILNIDIKKIMGNFETSISGKTSISGDLNEGKIELDLSGSVLGKRIESLKGCVSFGKGLLVEDIILNDRLSLQGRLDDEKIDMSVSTKKFDISPFLPFTGVLNGEVKISGTFKHPILAGSFYIEDFRYKLLQARYISSNLNVERLHKSFFGEIDFAVAHLVVPGSEFNNISGKVFLSDKIVFNVNGEGEDISLSIVGDMYKGDITLDTLIYSTGDVILKNNLPIQLSVRPPSVFVNRCVVAVNRGYFECKGRYNPQDMDLALIGEDISLASLRRDVKGEGSIWLKMNGDIKSPSIQCRQRIVNLTYSGVKIDTTYISAGYTQNLLTIDEASIIIKGERSEIKGYIPINLFPFSFPSEDMNLSVRLENLPPDIWKPLRKYVIVQAGKTNAELSMLGSPLSPRITGYVDLKGLVTRIPLYGVSFSGLNSRIRFLQEKIEIENFAAESAGGKLGLDGYLIISPFSWKQLGLFLDFKGENIPFQLPEGEGVVDMDIALRGTVAHPVVNSNAKIDKALMVISIPSRPSRFLEQEFDLDLTVDMPERVWIRSSLPAPISPIPGIENPIVDLEMGGKVSSIKRGNEIFLTGTMEVKQGYFYYIDRPFEVVEGSFVFDNTPGFDPLVNLKAKSEVIYTILREGEAQLDTTTVYVTLGGRVSELQFSMYSEPELPLESIVIMLSLNAPWGEFDIVNVPDRLVNLLIRGTVLADIEKMLGVDVLWFETSMFGEEKMARITAGKYISPDLYASYTKDLFAPSWSFKTRYRIIRGLSLMGQRTEEEEYNVGMEVEIRY